MRLRLQSPIYRFEDDYGESVWALRKPWWRKRAVWYSGVFAAAEDQDILSNERVVDLTPLIANLQADTTEFTSMLYKIAEYGARDDTPVVWLEDKFMPHLLGVQRGWGEFEWIDPSRLSAEAQEAIAYFEARA